MKTLVVAEHNNTELSAATLSVVEAAKKLGKDIDILVAGDSANAVLDQAKSVEGVSSVLSFNDSRFTNEIAEDLAECIISVAEDYSYFLASSSTTGKNNLPRAAALMDLQQISEVIEIIDDKTFKKPIYAGSCIATVKSDQEKNVLTIRTTAFDKSALGSGNAEIVEKTVPDTSSRKAQFVKNELTVSDRPELTSADIVISGGRGMQNAENFALLEGIATKLNAAVGASRAAVDSGFAPNDYQVGQTGKSVAPNLYIAVGISGAIQHLAGMKDSKTIVAINKDEEAPIFKVADYGLVADLFEALPELESKL
ncbi:MAG: electron transfer flavoprotein subunit alpha [Gammaproteobacteria bacterium]|nr:electron transfer flavoprotein subunit alpha [Gammaproteobacteria bacterium]|tara:strand:+ start:741 stop:1673 length:933 start_codon:yes stop_codon:yes gene_type:complete